MIHKSARKAATIQWPNGNQVSLWISANHNTGDTIVWQVVQRAGKLGRPRRITGRNIARLADELRTVVSERQGALIYRDAALVALIA